VLYSSYIYCSTLSQVAKLQLSKCCFFAKLPSVSGSIFGQLSLQKLLMGLFSFLKFSKGNKSTNPYIDANEYAPSFWEDDYCQIEIVPVENKAFILKQAKEIDRFAESSRTNYGYTETFERGTMPVQTLSKEIRADYLEQSLLGFQFAKAKHIRYENSKILNCDTGKTKAFGFSNFTVFFDIEEEFVKNIWVHIGLIVSVTQFDLIETAFYTLGEECALILIDWNSSELFDLSDKTHIQKYLMGYWK
jgi:hypothetical protein